MAIRSLLLIICLTATCERLYAFQLPRRHPSVLSRCRSTSDEFQDFISSNYPSFSTILSKNNDAIKAINKSVMGYTMFVPNENAFSSLGEKKRAQLIDVRNDEVVEKISAYHVIAEPVTAKVLFDSGGVITLGGEVMCERSVSGGMFGIGGKEDGGVALNGSKVLKTFEFSGNGKKFVVHEMDGLISPNMLWRYADQLRIPGSK